MVVAAQTATSNGKYGSRAARLQIETINQGTILIGTSKQAAHFCRGKKISRKTAAAETSVLAGIKIVNSP